MRLVQSGAATITSTAASPTAAIMMIAAAIDQIISSCFVMLLGVAQFSAPATGYG